MNKVYMCIDLKSFYASVECVERGLNPLTTNLVVADLNRTEKTVCLAVTPSLKEYGLSGRSRLYEVVGTVKKVNQERRKNNNYRKFKDKSYDAIELEKDKSLELDYIVAPPRMAFYIDYSTRIYNIYLKYISKEDIIVYSIDEVFCDITSYLKTYKMTPMELVTKIINDVYKETGITATAGIGTNLYLAKIAMDIVAKHAKPDKNGARIAYLDEELYRKQLWGLKPLTKFWRVGPGIANRLAKYGIMTMGDIARTSIKNEDFLYKLFGVNAELLIDHAWGYEPCTIDYIKQYRPSNSSLSSGQVLHVPYDYKKAKIVLREMADSISLDLVEKHLVTDQVILNIGYDVTNLEHKYEGDITVDHYGRKVPKPAHGSINLKYKTSSSKAIIEAVCSLYDEIVNPKLLIRKLTIAVNNLKDEKEATNQKVYEQFDLFSNMVEEDSNLQNEISDLENENKIQHVLIDIKKKYGKNAILKGTSLEEGATARDRNKQIGGHRE